LWPPPQPPPSRLFRFLLLCSFPKLWAPNAPLSSPSRRTVSHLTPALKCCFLVDFLFFVVPSSRKRSAELCQPIFLPRSVTHRVLFCVATPAASFWLFFLCALCFVFDWLSHLFLVPRSSVFRPAGLTNSTYGRASHPRPNCFSTHSFYPS